MLKQLFVFLLLLGQSFGSYHCKNPQTCQVQCKNYDFFELKKLENTNWIPVLWNSGHCYFHNTLTKEDIDSFPNIN